MSLAKSYFDEIETYLKTCFDFSNRFTKDIFAGFVATVFIYEALLQTFGVSSFKEID